MSTNAQAAGEAAVAAAVTSGGTLTIRHEHVSISEHVPSEAKVEISKNAKGDYQWSVTAYDADPAEAVRKAREMNYQLRQEFGTLAGS